MCDMTPADYLLADLVSLGHLFPGGQQIAIGLRLDQSVAEAESLFATKDLPMRAELVAELTLWRCHAEEGVELARRVDRVLQTVMEEVSLPDPRRPRP